MKTTRQHFFLLLAIAMIAWPGTPLAQDDFADRTQFTEVTMRITHRIYPSFADTLSVEVMENVQIGDTEFSFEITKFLADFGIKPDGTLVSRSSTPHNPAFEIVVFEDDEEVDRHWAFFGTGKPHYQRDSLLAFEILNFHFGDKIYTASVPRKDSSQ